MTACVCSSTACFPIYIQLNDKRKFIVMKRFLSILCVLIVLMQCAAMTVVTESADVTFVMGAVEGKAGETVSVALSVESTAKWNSIALSAFTYDTEVLTFVGFENYDDIAENAFLSSFDDDKGAITVALSPAKAYSGKLCDIVFKINDDVQGEAVSSVKASVIAKLSSKVLSTALVDGSITIEESDKPKVMKGDVNSDGVVDMKDAAMLQRHVLKIDIITDENALVAAELTGDEIVDMKDAAKLTRYVIKVIDSLE